MKLWLTRKDDALVPTNRASLLLLEDIAFNRELRADLKMTRVGWMHRLYWAFATYVAKTLNLGPGDAVWTPEEVVANFKRACGHVEYFVVSDDEVEKHSLPSNVVMREKSIAYEKMDQIEFGALFDETLVYVQVHLCPYLLGGPFKSEIEHIIAKFGRMNAEQLASA